MKIVTHDGMFHADDVLAAAILSLALPLSSYEEITRSKDESIWADADILFDAGGAYNPEEGRYDTNRSKSPLRKNKIPRSSASLLWYTYQEKAIRNVLTSLGYEDTEFYQTYFEDIWQYIGGHIDTNLLLPVDVIDSDVGKYLLVSKNSSGASKLIEGTRPPLHVHSDSSASTLSAYLKSFNPSWWGDLSPANQDSKFFEAVGVAVKLLENDIEEAYWFQQGRQMTIDKAVETSKSDTPHILVLDKYIPCKSHLFAENLTDRGVDIHFMVFPVPDSHTSEWKVSGIAPSRKEWRAVKTPLPAAWGGLGNSELQEISNYADAIFCHWDLSFAVFGSKQSALAVANSLVNHERLSERADVSAMDVNV